MLADKDVFTKRHSAAREMFSLHFIKTGEIPEMYKDDFALLFERRQMADYDMDGDFPIDEIQRVVKIAENFLTYVKTTYA
ncbi:HEPN domain-containing protein [Spirosoma sp. KUDC1026]|uniref:HEPN domain-containing protein n=1 Tax=Spirosoma sp. KUDC1026 TaxID=2745947 RepID=UPI00159BEC0D|nr:HEPN domain-containing protein [Spirosoma sp. KUDC1026]QKZ15632.1 HEPN domain-containing protein [Spirosoma sp. KUDC1026]